MQWELGSRGVLPLEFGSFAVGRGRKRSGSKAQGKGGSKEPSGIVESGTRSYLA